MLNLLKHPWKFLSAFCLMFAAGAVATPEGGEAIIPGEEGGGEGSEGAEGAGLGEGEGGEGAEGEDAAAAGEGEGEGEGEGQGKDTSKHPLIEGDGRTLPADLRGVVASLKATNPTAAAKIKDLYFGFANLQNQIKQSFPGGLQEAIEIKDAVEDLAGPEGVTELRSEIENWRGVDDLLQAGDPAILTTIQNEFPDGFKKLLPQMVNIWADADGEAYDRHMAGIIVGTLQQNQVSNDIARAIDYLDMQETNPVLDKVKALLTGTQGKISKLAEFANSKPKAPEKDPNAEKNQAESARIEGEKTKLFVGDVSRSVDKDTDPKIDTELKRLGAKNLTAEGRKTIGQKVRVSVAGELRKQPGFLKKYNAYIARKDHNGAVQFLTSRMDPLLKGDSKTKGAVETVYTGIYGKAKLGAQVVKPKPAAAAAGAGKPGEKPVQGWLKVAPDKAPAPGEIDMKASPFEMRMKKQAILKNGKKVYWGDKVPS